MHVLSTWLRGLGLLVGTIGVLMTGLGMLAEWGLGALLLGIVVGPITYFLMPFYALVAYRDPFLLLTNLVVPGVLGWMAGALDPA